MTTDDLIEDIGEYVAIAIIMIVAFFVVIVAYWFAHLVFVCVSNLIFRTKFAIPDWEDAKTGGMWCSIIGTVSVALLFLTAP